MLKCGRCGEMKPPDEFHRRSKSKSGRQSFCKACASTVVRKWYSENSERHKVATAARAARHRANLKEIVFRLKSAPCMDCGQTFIPSAMDFDHVRGVKDKDINELVHRGATVKRVLAEIAKCDLVCATCHRLRTWARLELASVAEMV